MDPARVLRDVFQFWFSHIASEEHLILPTLEDHKPWFVADAAFDQECRTRFLPILASLREENATTSSVLRRFNPQSAVDWLSLTILLDQLPRNCYRGAEAVIAFTFFDPLALAIAKEAVKAGIPSARPEFRYRLTMRFWFYLPMIHSEVLADQNTASELYNEMVSDVEVALGPERDDHFLVGEDTKGDRESLRMHPTEARNLCVLHMQVQNDHRAQIMRFGRFPHRNEVLGRINTPEEEEFLKQGKRFG
ncbi:DUF924-domain-containing protein [Aspergillus carlsbadensis]|nr:DUF924-domain-containing protein [Aspergillus carlsbadensis]